MIGSQSPSRYRAWARAWRWPNLWSSISVSYSSIFTRLFQIMRMRSVQPKLQIVEDIVREIWDPSSLGWFKKKEHGKAKLWDVMSEPMTKRWWQSPTQELVNIYIFIYITVLALFCTLHPFSAKFNPILFTRSRLLHPMAKQSLQPYGEPNVRMGISSRTW